MVFILLNLNKNQGTGGYSIGDQAALWGYRVKDVAVGFLYRSNSNIVLVRECWSNKRHR